MTATRWSDALSSSGLPKRWGGVRFGTRLVDSRSVEVAGPVEAAYSPIQRIGGRAGWYYGNWLWRLRGWLDLLVGGVGLRRGRRDATELRVGDPVDCWRVESLEPNRRLRLFAEMKLPGRAWLEFEVEPTSKGSLIRQTAIFDPVGLTGLTYWYAIYPLHEFVFGGMLNGIANAARTSIDTKTTWRPTVVRQVIWLIGFITVCFSAAGLGATVTATSVGGWNPPDWLFGPVGTALYLLMAVAGWLVWRRGGWTPARGSIGLFGLQLSLNVGWSAIFFGLRSPGFAFLEIVALWLAIAATAIGFRKKSSMAALLLMLYLAWTSFAVVLNLAIWSLNR